MRGQSTNRTTPRNRRPRILQFIELMIPTWFSQPSEVWRINIRDRYDLNRWRTITEAFTEAPRSALSDGGVKQPTKVKR